MRFGFRDIILAAALGALGAALSAQPDPADETFYGTLVELDGVALGRSGSAVTLSVVAPRASEPFYRVYIDCLDVGFRENNEGPWISHSGRLKPQLDQPLCPAEDPARLERIVGVMAAGGDIVVNAGDSAVLTSEVGRAKFAIRYRPIE